MEAQWAASSSRRTTPNGVKGWALVLGAICWLGFIGTGAFQSDRTHSAMGGPAASLLPPPGEEVQVGGPNVVTQLPSNLDWAQLGPNVLPTPAGHHKGNALSPGCSSTSSCPMGITDYGVTPTLSTYNYKFKTAASYFDTSDHFGIGSQTGSGGCLDPHAQTGYCVTIQQNLVASKVNVANNVGTYWTQNVPEVAYDKSCSSPCVSGTYSVTWLDNVWNFSYSSICASHTAGGHGCLNPSNIKGNLSALCASSAIPTSGAQAYEFYYCTGPTVYNLTPPFTVFAYTTLGGSPHCTPTSTKTCVSFYGDITSGPSVLYGAYFDAVSFAAGSLGAGSPYYSVANKNAPVGLPFDFEWVVGGPGASSVGYLDTHGDLQSFYCASGCAGVTTYHTITHAWSSGADTAESVKNVDVIPVFNVRDLAQLWNRSDNPQTSVW